jgi:hypothetical protein
MRKRNHHRARRHAGPEDCASAISDYSDVVQGTQVVVTNSAGAVIAASQLGAGAQNNLPGLGNFGATCNYSFTVQVPGGLARYGITISRRGTIWFSAKQMQEGPVEISQGDMGRSPS